MFSQWPSWLSRSPRVRRAVIKIWRAFLRVQRATLANAVLVVRRQDDRVLAFTAEASGEFRLPSIELDGWRPVGTQVRFNNLRRHSFRRHPNFRRLTEHRKGVTFLYSADVAGSPQEVGCTWLEAELAPSALSVGDRRLLLMSKK
jgi:hypothetical protein